MAAGSEVPTHGPLNIGYGYSPSVYQPQAIAVPQGAGALWAGVGKTALDAGAAMQSAAQALQQSPVNPAVKAKQDYDVSQLKYGQDVIQHARDTGDYGWLRARTTPQGAEVLAPAETGASFAPLFQPKKTEEQKKGEPPAPEHAPGTGSEPQEKTTPQPEEKKEDSLENPPDVASSTAQPDSISKALASTLVPSHGGSTAAATAGGDGQLNTGQPQSPDVVATPAQPPAPQPSSIWSPGRPAPLAPPAPGPAPAPAQPAQPAQGQSPAAATMADQANMAKWRAQNEHPVMSSQDALGWMKNFDTGVKRATYLPMGGPGGSPAFAFHMDGGGINTVPVSQMAQKGGGPLIASQNTSQVISSTDQQQQAAQNQPNISPPPPANLPQQPNISPPPPANLPQMPPTGQVSGAPTGTAAQPWGPPPAPTGPQVAQAPTQYPNISGPPPAPVTGAYDPAMYRQGIAQAMAQPGNLMAQERPQAGVRSTDNPPPRTEIEPLSDQEKAVFTPEAIANIRANAKPDPNQPRNATEADGTGGDPYVGELGNWHLYRDDRNQTHEVYAIRQGLSSLFKQQRYILGSDGWREYELPNTNMRLSMEGMFTGGKGGVVGAVMPPGPDGKPTMFRGKNTFPSMSHDEIAALSVPAMQKWQALAGKYYNTTGEANSTMDQRFNGLMDMGQRTQRLLDGQEIAHTSGIPSEAYSREAQGRSAAARERDALRGVSGTSTENPAELIYDAANTGKRNANDMAARGEKVNPLSDYLEEQVRRMNDAESQLPGRHLALLKPGSDEGTSLTASGYGLSGTLKLGSGDQTSKSPHLAVNRLFENAPYNEARSYLISHKAEIDRQFEQSYNDAIQHNYRLNPEVIAYHNLLVKHAKDSTGSELDKPNVVDANGNRFRDQNGRLVNPWPDAYTAPRPVPKIKEELQQSGALPKSGAGGPGSRPVTGNASPTPTPVVRTPADLAAFKKKYPAGAPFLDADGHPHTYQ